MAPSYQELILIAYGDLSWNYWCPPSLFRFFYRNFILSPLNVSRFDIQPTDSGKTVLDIAVRTYSATFSNDLRKVIAMMMDSIDPMSTTGQRVAVDMLASGAGSILDRRIQSIPREQAEHACILLLMQLNDSLSRDLNGTSLRSERLRDEVLFALRYFTPLSAGFIKAAKSTLHSKDTVAEEIRVQFAI